MCFHPTKYVISWFSNRQIIVKAKCWYVDSNGDHNVEFSRILCVNHCKFTHLTRSIKNKTVIFPLVKFFAYYVTPTSSSSTATTTKHTRTHTITVHKQQHIDRLASRHFYVGHVHIFIYLLFIYMCITLKSK